MKAWLKTIKEKHIEETGNIGQDNPNFYFLPTVWVLERLRDAMMIREQVNSILFGVTYKKNEEYFETEYYMEVVNCLTEYERKDMIVGTKDSPNDQIERPEVNGIFSPRSIIRARGEERKNKWDERLRMFLIKSNEKWILDQFNLWKKFFNQNSIHGKYEDFIHPSYQYWYKDFNHMRIMRDKYQKNEKYGKHKGMLSQVITSLKTNNTKRKTINTTELQGFEMFDLSWMKWDIWALLRAIEEIENRVRMSNYI